MQRIPVGTAMMRASELRSIFEKAGEHAASSRALAWCQANSIDSLISLFSHETALVTSLKLPPMRFNRLAQLLVDATSAALVDSEIAEEEEESFKRAAEAQRLVDIECGDDLEDIINPAPLQRQLTRSTDEVKLRFS